MHYISTRGRVAPLSFQEAVMTGLARDGGLLLPASLPQIDEARLQSWQQLSYQELALEIFTLFVDDLKADSLRALINTAYASFSQPQVTPLRPLDDRLYVLELFHGPTLAFKDVALQLLGGLFAHILARQGGVMNILGATSGDTGSAAIAGVRGKPGVNIFILHPHGRTSPIQALQMTTVLDANVFNLAVEGSFDDAQAIVKGLFADLAFRDQHHLGAVNSINWARVLAQVVYYVFALLQLPKAQQRGVDFAVPTGNFGDIFAGWVAKQLLPAGVIERLILATNQNDILCRFVCQGHYARQGEVIPTSSPSMDIQIASNFERYLYYLYGEDGAQVEQAMQRFRDQGALDLTAFRERTARDFRAAAASEEQTLATIAATYAHFGYLIDPHTAVGLHAAQQCREDRPVICLATAHPAKFGAAIRQAIGHEPELPPQLAELAQRPTRCQIIPAEEEAVRRFVAAHAL